MENDNKPSFFDPKTLVVVASIAIIYLGWQTYLQKKYPNYGKPAAAVEKVQNTIETTPSATASSESSAAPVSGGSATTEVVAKSTYVPTEFKFSSDKISFVLNSLGMGLKEVTINNYTDKDNNPIKIATSESVDLFSTQLSGVLSPIEFNVSEVAPGHYIGKAVVGAAEIVRELKYNSANNSFSNKMTISNPGPEFSPGISILVSEKILTPQSSSFLFPSMEFQDFVVEENGKVETVHILGAKENISKDISSSPLVAVSSHYFAASVLDKSELLPKVSLSADIQSKEILAKLNYVPTQLREQLSFEQVLYVGPKSMEALKSVDAEMVKVIDFGFFGFIAVPLLHLLKFCFSLVGNWGVAIILLTLIVRVVVLPFNVMSFRSMKAMQKIQPAVQTLREKYKEDPMRLNQEMMALMKENGANPLGGCLPMLLQIPVFFALYKVINSSVELYQSPFVLWITDLSLHDKFYVLPVLMGVLMYVQQKMTPTTMDPTQAKIMAFLPLIFSVFMLNLPSGLTLYMFVSALFGFIQQYLMMREKPVSK